MSGGYAGVDVFFVISGYLITGIIFRQVEDSKFRLLDFLSRRIRRIAPASMVMISCVLIAGVLLMTPAALDQLATSAFCQQFFLSNIYFSLISDYFAAPAERMPLLHTWTLALEEQFYVLLPVGLPWILRWGKLFTQRILWMLTISSFILGIWASMHYPVAAFFWLPTRFWELSAGSLLALHTTNTKTDESRCENEEGNSGQGHQIRSRWRLELLAGFALSMLVVAFVDFDKSLAFPGYHAAVPVIGTVLLIGLGSYYQSLVYRVLSSRLLVGVGLISYSLYLWHWPVFSFLQVILSDLSLHIRLCGVLASFAIAICSWRWIEQPPRKATWFKPWNVIGLYVIAVGALAFATLFIAKSDGLPSRMQPRTLAAIRNLEIKHQSYATSIAELEVGSVPRIGSPSASPTFLIWGDSHALSASEVISRRALNLSFGGWIAADGGNPPLLGVAKANENLSGVDGLIQRNRLVLDFIEKHKVKHVLLIAAWQSYRNEDFASTRYNSDGSRISAIEDGLIRTIESLKSIPTQISIFRQPPVQGFDVGQTHLNRMMFGWPSELPSGCSRDEFEDSRRHIDSVFRKIESRYRDEGLIEWIDPVDQFFDANGNSKTIVSQRPLYVDTNHLTSDGVDRFYRDAIEKMLQSWSANPSNE